MTIYRGSDWDLLEKSVRGLAKLAGPLPDEEYAERMGYDCVVSGANTTNCNFRIFGRPELTKAWERGKRKAEQEKGGK